MSHPRLGRRAFIGALGGGALALLLPSRGRRPLHFEPAPAIAAAPFQRPLPIPRVLDGDHIRIPIREAEAQILPGEKTKLWAYGGTFPGPTIRRRAGQRTKVSFEHRLPAAAGELTVHLHGGHNRSQFDGQPGGLTKRQPISYYCRIPSGLSRRQSGNDLLIEPGGRRTYVYDLTEDGEPERAAFQWYHDHRLDRTSRNVWHGLAGMWIVDDELDSSLPLPSGERDIPLMLAERSFDRRNQLTDPFGGRPPRDGVLGSAVLVNGAHMPHHRVAPCRHRLRLLNASPFRNYVLQLSNGAPMVQIATESGLMPRPLRRREILLGPGERVEVVVDFAAAAGETVELRSARRESGPSGRRRATGYAGALMQFRVGSGSAADRTRLPRRLRPLPAWTGEAKRQPDFRWEITLGGLFRPRWLINGETYNPARSLAFPRLGTVETWEIVNHTNFAHVMHLHHSDWLLLARDGRPPPPWEDCLKETFYLHPNERILVAGRFADHLGRFVIHCHMLDHEDHGLMSQFEVVRG